MGDLWQNGTGLFSFIPQGVNWTGARHAQSMHKDGRPGDDQGGRTGSREIVGPKKGL